MPYTVWSSFEAFRRNSVDLDPKQTDTARRSRDNLKSILENCEDKDSTFPTLTKRYLDFGSFARKTKVIEIDDIDMMVILNGKDTYEYQSNGEPYQRLLRIKESTAPLAKFNDGYNFVSSIKILNNIRDSLNLRYTKASIHRRQQAVTLDLSSYPWVFDIVLFFTSEKGTNLQTNLSQVLSRGLLIYS